MKHIKRITIVVALAFLVVMGMQFTPAQRVWLDWMKGEKQAYQGNINLWHIKDSFDLRLPYATMFKRFEKNNFGVFINVHYLTIGEAEEKLAAGEQPDLVTYTTPPSSMADGFTPLSKQDNPILQAGEREGDIVAYPICYDSYRLLINDDMLGELEIDVPGLLDVEYVKTVLTGENFGEGVAPLGFSEPGAALNYLSAGEPYPFEYNEASLKDFETGKVAMMVCTSLGLEKYTGELPSYTDLYISPVTDRIRFLSVYGGKNDENRLQCNKDIAAQFMGERWQKQIGEYGFSPIYGYSAIKSEEIQPVKVFYNKINKEVISQMCQSDPVGLLRLLDENLLK